MKHSICFTFAIILVMQSFAFSRRDDGTSMKPILREALIYIQTVEEKNLKIVRMEFDILNEIKSTFRMLHAELNYGIFAFGDYRILDIDIAVYKNVDGTWVLIKKDTDASSAAAVNIKPSSTDLYRIDIIGYKYEKGFTGGRYCLLIFHD